MRKALGLSLLVSALILSGVAIAGFHTYEKFEIEDLDSGTERVYAECFCLGGLTVLESYPPQYRCGGPNFCRSVNYTRNSSIN